MKKQAKVVTYVVDLYPGWQDVEYVPDMTDPKYAGDKGSADKRILVEVPLPCFGGTADADEIIRASVKSEVGE